MHDYDRYALLVGRIPVFLLASTCTEYELYSCIQPPKGKFSISVNHIYLFVVFHCHFLWFVHVLPLKPSKYYHLFCETPSSWQFLQLLCCAISMLTWGTPST